MSSRRRGGLHFVHLTHPDDAGKWKRQVRSHAARNSPARQNRVIRHQNEKANHVKTTDISEAHSSAYSCVSGNVVSQDTCIPDISVALSTARTDPFDTFVRKTTQFERFLLDYFVNYVVRQAVICFPFRATADEVSFRQGMATHWVQMAATDAGMLAAIFLAACRHLSENHHLQVFSTLALQYRGQCISALNTSISQEETVVSDLTITKTLALASDAILTSDYAASNRHIDAARLMVTARGGIETRGMNGLLRRLVIWFIKDPLQNGNPLLWPCICVKNNSGLYGRPPDVTASPIASIERIE
ncbi:hypothetical protein OIDMADRAFT_184962 [Oidiodendron maius Zn]|uniref:Uncharacterized protein n=1 Tax=Oidiodendron maius (strain Zn) TaxID=913774 RepID=A0A0C3CTG3_OIDMZ|nr:hypothetical protein OIDMADRAFT_184962 [Oidiodendron maius Zn]